MAARTKKKSGGGKASANNGTATTPPLTFDKDRIRSLARGRWPQILSRIAGLDPDLCDESHHPCPKCGGTDRWRFTNMDGDGSSLCNNCGKFGDGFATAEHLTGKKFAQVLELVANELGVEGTPFLTNGHAGGKSKWKDVDPAKDLKFQPWNDFFAARFCQGKQGVTPEAIQAVGGKIARYKDRFTVIALPVWGKDWRDAAAKPIGWVIYNHNGGTLPKWSPTGKKKPDGKPEFKEEQVKVKVTWGSQAGIIADRAKLAADSMATIWKLEGPSDLLSFLSMDLPSDVAAFTTANGAGERPQAWMLDLAVDRQTLTLHDADQPGEAGADTWASNLSRTATASRKVTLPYEVAATHGKDFRDWKNEAVADSPRTYADLLQLPQSEPFEPPAEPLKDAAEENERVLEAGDDPHYLARMNLERYATLANSATLRYWRSEWYTWKPARGCYKKIDERELGAKVTSAVKEEFDRQWREDYARWKAEQNEDEPVPIVRKISKNLIANVLNSMSAEVLIPSSVELMTWLNQDTGSRTRRNYMAMSNGILDLDRLIEDRPEDTISDVLLPHSPQWFSLTRLPYDFDPAAECPKWQEFLEYNLEMDPERIKLLQEFSGYCLLPDTSMQRFLFLEGRGANGKSVFLAALRAMLGEDNCSSIALERFGERFEKTETLGKLVNICSDVGDIDKTAEGMLKSFTSGESMYFDRRYIGGINARPTARMVMAGNKRPHFHDRSEGIWRRMIIVPWLVEVSESRKVYGMDDPAWWERTGELPGIFLWALQGLDRLRRQKRFTESTLAKEAKEEYRDEMNPTRVFIKENLEVSDNSVIRCDALYRLYQIWMEKNGRNHFSSEMFGKELRVTFGKVERKRGGSRQDRYWYYHGIAFTADEIYGEKTSDATLF